VEHKLTWWKCECQPLSSIMQQLVDVTIGGHDY